MGREIVRKILEEEAKIWNASQLVERISTMEEINEKTAYTKYINYYQEDEKGNKKDYIIKEGVVYVRKGRSSLYYAEKYKEEIEKNLNIIEEKIKLKIKENQKLIERKKKELKDSFEYWLRYKIKLNINVIGMFNTNLLNYTLGESKNIPYYTERLKKAKEEEKEEYFRGIYSREERVLFCKENYIFLDALLTHPVEEIRNLGWKWFIYYKEKEEEYNEKLSLIEAKKDTGWLFRRRK